MPTSYTYATLVADIQAWTEDDSAEFLASIPSILARAEDKLLRDLNLEIFDVEATGTFTVNSEFVTKPSNYLFGRTLGYTDADGRWNALDPKTVEYIRDYWPVRATTGTPKYYAEYDETRWIVAPTAAAALTWKSRHCDRPAGLSASTTTTWLGTNAGDALLLACLINAEGFLDGDDRVAAWKAQYDEDVLPATQRELRRMQRADYAPLAPTPAPNQPPTPKAVPIPAP